MTLTVRQSSVTGATTAGRPLTYAEMDADWDRAWNFTPSGTSPTKRAVSSALDTVSRSGDFASNANWIARVQALTETLGILGLQTAQATEAAGTSILTHNWVTSGHAPFQIQEISAANTGAAAGTYNHAVWFGFNVPRHSSIGSATSSKPALIMGMEDNYYDDGGDNAYGMEWYVEYFSPDGTSVQLYRPYYARVYSGDDTKHHAHVYQDIGTDGSGSWHLYAGLSTQLISVTPTLITTTIAFTVGGKMTANYGSFIGGLTYDTSADRVGLGALAALPTSSNGAYVGWANGISGTLAGDLCLIPRSSVNGALRVFTGNGTPAEKFSVDVNGSATVGALSALSTSATDGFLYIPTSAGAPTGTPTTKTGKVAMEYDTTNNKLYVYNSGWKSVTLA